MSGIASTGTIPQPRRRPAGADERFEQAWAPPGGLRRLAAVNNSRMGLRFIVTTFVFFLAGGVLALLMRAQLIVPESDLLSAAVYNQLFTMHGTTMMFLFAVPMMEAFAMYLIPAMIGARDLCFPRLTAYGYWCFLFGGLLLFSSFLIGSAPDGGWFMYVPLTTLTYSPGINQDFWLLGVTFVEIATVSGALELIGTILKTRAPGMALSRMPIFAWYMLAVAFMVLFAFPPLILASVLLEVERAFGIPFYDVARGGDPLLWQHLFWIFGHPEVYIIFLPAAGLASAMLPALARGRLVGYQLLVLAAVGTAFLSFGLWVHHMYATGLPQMALSFFAGASMAVAIPSGIQVFAWIATLWKGRPVLRTPLLFLAGFIVIFVLGGLTGVMVAMVGFDWQVHDTYFLVAHFHYVLIGGMVFPLFAALHYYVPLATGRLLSESLGKLSFWLLFIGFNVAFFPMHLTGLLGMPRRVFTYPADLGWDELNALSSVGAFVVAAGALVYVVNFFRSRAAGAPAGDDPWGADGLEWANGTPSPPYNLRSIPTVGTVHPLWDEEGLAQRIRAGREYLARAPEGRRETLATSVVDATPQYVLRLPHPTFVPLVAAVATAVAFIGVLAEAYAAALAGVAALVVISMVWIWDPPLEKDSKDAGNGLRLPIHLGDQRSTGWLGAVLFVLADAALFASLVFGYFYLWTSAEVWPPPGHAVDVGAAAPASGLLAGALLIAAVAWHRGAAQGSRALTLGGLAAGVVLMPAILYVAYQAYAALPFGAHSHVYAAFVAALGGYYALHVAIALVTAGYALARVAVHEVRPDHSLSARVAALLTWYAVLQGVVVFGVVLFTQRVAGAT